MLRVVVGWRCAKGDGGNGDVLRVVVEWRCAKGGGGSGGVLREVVGKEVC